MIDCAPEDRCEVTHLVVTSVGPAELRCTRDRRHVEAPIGWVEPGPAGRRIYLLESARPHRFVFEVPLGE